jgi:hypothetical protein
MKPLQYAITALAAVLLLAVIAWDLTSAAQHNNPTAETLYEF